jgi:cyclic pyranopterin phosphate synthase
MTRMTHLDEYGRARMVDVTRKKETVRVAVARGSVLMKPDTLAMISRGEMAKGMSFPSPGLRGSWRPRIRRAGFPCATRCS